MQQDVPHEVAERCAVEVAEPHDAVAVALLGEPHHEMAAWYAVVAEPCVVVAVELCDAEVYVVAVALCPDDQPDEDGGTRGHGHWGACPLCSSQALDCRAPNNQPRRHSCCPHSHSRAQHRRIGLVLEPIVPESSSSQHHSSAKIR